MVEDEPLVRLTQVDILREAEIWVVEAQDADALRELIPQHTANAVASAAKRLDVEPETA